MGIGSRKIIFNLTSNYIIFLKIDFIYVWKLKRAITFSPLWEVVLHPFIDEVVK